jgi:hypothetical protein
MPPLSEPDREKAIELLARLRGEIAAAAGEDTQTIFQMKRYIAKRLEFDERGTPTERRKLKDLKWKKQRGLCPVCQGRLPERGAELDRFKAIDGYTVENTQLVCHGCHGEAEAARMVEKSRTQIAHPSKGSLEKMMMRVLATFATRDIADSMKDLLAEHGFNANDTIIMVNRGTVEPPEDAELEVGTEGAKGLAGFEEKIGKTVNALFGKKEMLEGTGSEGDGNGGALLELTVSGQDEADRAVELLTLHQAADIEVTPIG